MTKAKSAGEEKERLTNSAHSFCEYVSEKRRGA